MFRVICGGYTRIMQLKDSTLALAGIFQSAELVKQIARQGRAEEASYLASIESVLQLKADSTEAVFGGVEGVRLGLQCLIKQLGQDAARRDPEVLRYALGLTVLERKLSKQAAMLDKIGAGVSQAQQQAELFGSLHANVIASLADLYVNTLSTFNYRIHVNGDPNLLHSENTVKRIRALLLAGIRSAVLWRQKGGGRLQLLFKRRKILLTAQTLLAELEATRH